MTGYEDWISVSTKANQVYDLEAGYYSETDENGTSTEISSASVQEGMETQMKFTVTNNGNGNDEVTLSLANAPEWASLGQDTALVGPGQTVTLVVVLASPEGSINDYAFQVTATSADGIETATTLDLTLTVTEKITSIDESETEDVTEDDSPGFGIISVIAALGAVLLIRRRRL